MPGPAATKVTMLPVKTPAQFVAGRKPKGLFVVDKGIRKRTAQRAWEFFSKDPMTGAPGEFPWVQRFSRPGRHGHHNNWRSREYPGEASDQRMRDEIPELHALVQEAVQSMKQHLEDAGDDQVQRKFEEFRGETINVHLHRPNWGLGAHYDDAHEVGKGIVLMVSLGDEHKHPNPKPRTFRFTEPIEGLKCDVATRCRQVLLFTDEAYELWRHESLRRPQQTGDCISLTIRMRCVDGYAALKDGRPYAKGPGEAERVAHVRMRRKLRKFDPDPILAAQHLLMQ